jgi:hypothetical protein
MEHLCRWLVMGITDRDGARGEQSELVVGTAFAADTAGMIARLIQLMRLLSRMQRLYLLNAMK